ncbi:MAG: hypothetical protein KC877_00720 [Candidatus Kaiserbacteria bacterium]|nr:hypothetical protein [Candidatus Kaiserbacteria bacterium]MCB9815954.1 hypothetical protein [Candidatus Nomurabacteria bacterium]
MFKAIGLLILLWGLSQFFGSAFAALDSAARESFKTIEMAAIVSQQQLQTQLQN